MEQWYSSDLHLWHENIIKYCSRPFANAREMTEALITYHNELVQPEDHWTSLGDLTMLRGGRVQQEQLIRAIRSMNGHKRLILGNHDHFDPETYIRAGFEKIRGTGQWVDRIIFSHYPIHPGSMGRAKACVHGHTHDAPDEAPLISKRDDGTKRVQPFINISVERTDYRPITLGQINERIADCIRKFTEG